MSAPTRLNSSLALLFISALLVTVLASACTGSRGRRGPSSDGGASDMAVATDLGPLPDSGPLPDLGPRDLGVVDAGARDMSIVSACPGFSRVSGSCASPADGDVGLTADGNLLMVYHAGSWAGVCDDGFTTTGAAVVCRQLGLGDIGIGTTATGPNSTFWLDDVSCTGVESSIAGCSHSGWGTHNCGTTEWIMMTCGA